MNAHDELLTQLPEPMLDEFYERNGKEDGKDVVADLAGDYISELWMKNKELLEALEGLMRKFGDFENDPKSRGIGWNPEMIEALHDAENAIAKAKS